MWAGEAHKVTNRVLPRPVMGGREKKKFILDLLPADMVIWYHNLIAAYRAVPKTVTERAPADVFQRTGGWCEPGKRCREFVAPELEGRNRRSAGSRTFP